jgi:hypothetical protein
MADLKAQEEIRILKQQFDAMRGVVAEMQRKRDIEIVELTALDTILVRKYRITSNMVFVLCDATEGAFTVILPDVKSGLNQRFDIKKIDSGSNIVTMAGFDQDLIDGESSFELIAEGNNLPVVSDGVKWRIV